MPKPTPGGMPAVEVSVHLRFALGIRASGTIVAVHHDALGDAVLVEIELDRAPDVAAPLSVFTSQGASIKRSMVATVAPSRIGPTPWPA